jgi:hypothetical protein
MKEVWVVERRSLLVGLCALVASAALQGCRKEEQDRVLYFDKGTYLGKPDEPLTDEQVEALRQRASGQVM